MSAFDDSQDEMQETQSQDLFQAVQQQELAPVNIPTNVGKEILDKLRKMETILASISGDVESLKKQQDQLSKQSFSVENCSFKKKFNTYLREKFSLSPWLNTTSDVGFKNEVNINLQKEGFRGNPHAYKLMVQWATTKFTDYRNQLRRKIAHEIKEGKDIQAITVEDFAHLFLGSFCNSGDVASPERIQLCVILRSFLHSKKLNINGSDEIEFFCNFWRQFKEYQLSVSDSSSDDKWEKLIAIDTRRMKQSNGNDK